MKAGRLFHFVNLVCLGPLVKLVFWETQNLMKLEILVILGPKLDKLAFKLKLKLEKRMIP